MEKLTDFELQQWDNQLVICPENANIRKLIDEVKEYRQLMRYRSYCIDYSHHDSKTYDERLREV